MTAIAQKSPRTLVVRGHPSPGIPYVQYRKWSTEEGILRLRREFPTISRRNNHLGRDIKKLVLYVGGIYLGNHVPCRAPGDGYGFGLPHTSGIYLVPVNRFDELMANLDELGEALA